MGPLTDPLHPTCHRAQSNRPTSPAPRAVPGSRPFGRCATIVVLEHADGVAHRQSRSRSFPSMDGCALARLYCFARREHTRTAHSHEWVPSRSRLRCPIRQVRRLSRDSHQPLVRASSDDYASSPPHHPPRSIESRDSLPRAPLKKSRRALYPLLRDHPLTAAQRANLRPSHVARDDHQVRANPLARRAFHVGDHQPGSTHRASVRNPRTNAPCSRDVGDSSQSTRIAWPVPHAMPTSNPTHTQKTASLIGTAPAGVARPRGA